MKKDITQVDEKKGVYRITSLDERFYSVPSKDQTTGLPTYDYYPSASWIAGYYYQGKGLTEWLKKNGTDSDQIMLEAGARGSKVHNAIEKIIAGEELKFDTKVFNGQSGQEEELTTDEWEVVKTFVDWNDEVKPVYLLSEKTVISKKYKYGGTLDALVKIGDTTYLLDFKTSKAIYPAHIIQVSSYKQALGEETHDTTRGLKLAILQVGYKLNRKGWKFTEIDDRFDLFLHTKAIWEAENPSTKPKQIELPLTLKINNPLTQSHAKVPSAKVRGAQPL